MHSTTNSTKTFIKLKSLKATYHISLWVFIVVFHYRLKLCSYKEAVISQSATQKLGHVKTAFQKITGNIIPECKLRSLLLSCWDRKAQRILQESVVMESHHEQPESQK